MKEMLFLMIQQRIANKKQHQNNVLSSVSDVTRFITSILFIMKRGGKGLLVHKCLGLLIQKRIFTIWVNKKIFSKNDGVLLRFVSYENISLSKKKNLITYIFYRFISINIELIN